MNSKKLSLWISLLALVAVLAGVGFVGYKLWKRKENREANRRYQVTTVINLNPNLNAEQLDAAVEQLDERLDRYEVLRPVVKELELVSFWEVADADAALEKLRKNSNVTLKNGEVLFQVVDKDKEMAGEILQEVARSFERSRRLEKRLEPPPSGG